MAKQVNVFWFRRDLRVVDNRGLDEALSSDLPVLGLFVFDKSILDRLEDKDDARVSFLHQSVTELDKTFRENGSSLLVEHSTPSQVFELLLNSGEFKINKVFTNRDYEPYAIERDVEIAKLLGESGVEFESFKDHVIFHENEVVKDDGAPYVVFTPYKRKWLAAAKEKPKELKAAPSEKKLKNAVDWEGGAVPSLGQMGFKPPSIELQPKKI
ncbi:MAG: deoxyribodipyrimidine photo-lyase, partial [Bdellovibrionales bacterium]|nr:deoxyribodipyrimidine photo-lyase [Bdellovibrionales bacterium]